MMKGISVSQRLWENVPKICKQCLELNWQYDMEATWWYCSKNLWWPNYDQCKKHRKRMRTGQEVIVDE